MKKFFIFLLLFLGSTINVSAEIKRVVSGNENAKITIIAYESLTCSHCANFHRDIYPQLKKDYLDTGIAKIEFRHFPLDIAAFNAAKIVQCKYDKSLEILESLYTNQQEWVKGNTVEEVNENLKKFINKNGFNIDFEKCIQNKKIEDFVLNDRVEGANNKKFEKTLNYKNLKKTLEKLI